MEIKHRALFDFFIKDANISFSGWDFSYLADRMIECPLSWSYASKILMKVRCAESLLDMGTGGGEFLSHLQPLPSKTCATEGYTPNLSLARKKLTPLGVTIYYFEDDYHLPFVDHQFDLIINRHESYAVSEVWRILQPKGQFITQQVGGKNDLDLNKLLGVDTNHDWIDWRLEKAVKELEDVGFTIVEQKEEFPVTRFYDIGAIVYYLKAISWQIPDFSVARYFDKLVTIHHTILENGHLDIGAHRFLIIAQK